MSPLATTGFQAGQQIGSSFWLLIFVWLIARQARKLKDPQVNRKGAWAALLAYASIIVISLHSTFTRIVSVPPPLGVGLPVMVAVTCLVALVLGVQGLLEVRAIRRAGGTADRGSAGWGLGLSALLLLAMGSGAVSALRRGAEPDPDPAARAPAPPVRHEELGFTYQPPAGFSPVDMKKANPLAAVAYARRSPMVFFVVVAEGAHLENEELADAVVINLQSTGAPVEVLERGPHQVNGLSGIRLVSKTRVKGLEFVYVHWVHGGDAFAYQLVAWGPAGDAPRVREEAELLLRGFGVVAGARPAVAPVPPDRAWSFRSPPWRYAVELDRATYTAWDPAELHKEFPGADFGFRCGQGCGVFVLPQRVPDPAPSLDALGRALLDQLGFRYPAEDFAERRAVSAGPAAGIELSREVESKEGTWAWRLRVLRAGTRAWLVAGYAPAGDAPAAERRDAGIAAVTFQASATDEPPPAPAGQSAVRREARALNQIGLHEYELDEYATAAALFAQATRTAPDDRVLLENAAEAHAKAGLFDEGYALVHAGRPRFPASVTLEAWEALLASHVGKEREARASYARLFARGLADEGHLRRYVDLLEASGERVQALRLLARHRARHDGRELAILHAAVLQRAGERGAAIRVLRTSLARRPDAGVGYTLVDALLAGGRKQEALREAEALVRRFPGSGPLLAQRGRAEVASRRFERAKASFEAALERDPTSADARSWLEHVAGLLGQGANSSLKEPVEEVKLPDGLLGAAPPPAPEGHSAHFVERVIAFHFRKGKELRRTDRWLARAVDAAGVERLGTFSVGFDPLGERVFVNRVLVRDGAGKVVARGKPSDWYLSDDASGDLGTHRRTLHVQVPGLRPGYEVEVVVSRADLGAPGQMEFHEVALASDLPRLRSAVAVTGDVDEVATAATAGVETRRAPGALALVARAVTPFRPEPLRADFQEWLPTAWLGPRGGDWAAVGGGYEKELAEVDRPDATVAAIAAKETVQAKDAGEKLRILSRWVQKGITYRAIEFGRRGHVPHKLSETIQARFGDCKDHALVLKHLLVSTGVPAQLALVRTDGPLRPDLPSIDQFDHVVVYVPGVDGGTFVDATDKAVEPGRPPPGLGGKQALVVDGARSRLVAIPEEREGRLETVRQVSWTDDDLDVRERVRLEGPPAAAMRSYLSSVEPARRVAALQSFLARRRTDVRVTSVRVEALEELHRPLEVELRYVLAAKAAGGAAERTLPVPALWERTYLATEAVEDRTSPFRVAGLEVRSVVELRPPPGHALAPPAAIAPDGGSFGRWQLAAAADRGALRLEATLTRAVGRYGPDRWVAFQEEMERALAAAEPVVALRQAR